MATIVEMPKLSDTMTTGRLVRWLKNEGDTVKPGDMLAEVETDKATMELENFFAGTLLKQAVPAGTKVAIGAPICVIGTPGEAIPELKAPAAPAKTETAKAAAPKPATAPTAVPIVPPAPTIAVHSVPATLPADIRPKASPLAKKIAEDHGLDLRFVKGTGTDGRITAEDVEARLKLGIPVAIPTAVGISPSNSNTTPVATEAELPLSGMRETIARRLVESKTTIPHFYVEVEVDTAALSALRPALNKKLEAEGLKLTVNDFVLKAVADAIRAHPTINASWNTETIHQYAGVQLAFGVAIDAGLVTPVIRDAHTLGLKAIARGAKELTAKARAGKLTPAEMSGSTFTVTNLGMYGISRFYGIINPPNSAILSVGASRKVPVVDASGHIVAGERMTLGISCDHRVVDGALAALFLTTLKDLLENPALLLV